MSENIKNTAAESAQNAAGAAEAVTHDMTAEAVNEPVQADAGVYTHTFKKPFEYAGETYTTLTFDFEKMTGRDMVSIETEMQMNNCYAATTKSCWTKSTSGSGKDRTTKGGGTMTKYTTIAGDMWDGIAYKTLGDEAYTDRLMKLNPQYRRTFVFPAGITLTVPEPETRVSSDLPPWKRGTAE